MKKLFEIWNKFLKEEKQRVVTFDFDDTLALSHWGEEEDNWVHDGPQDKMIQEIKKFIEEPNTKVFIVTSRHQEHETRALKNPLQKSVKEFLDLHNINVDGVHFTDGKPKIETLLKLNSLRHHDDDPEDIRDAKENNIEAIVSDPYGGYEKLRADMENETK